MHFFLRTLWAKKFFLIGFTLGFFGSLGTLYLHRVSVKSAPKQECYDTAQEKTPQKIK
jgi:hypothetical protein